MKKSLQKYSIAFLIFSLVSVIAVAGCITGGGGGGGAFPVFGNDAVDLTLDTEAKTTFDSLQPFVITLQAENIGVFDVEVVEARLQGFDGITSSVNEVLSDLKAMGPATISKPEPDIGISGGVGDVSWDVYAPYVSEDSPDREIVLTGEVFYDTKSLATQKIVVLTRDYLDALEARGEPVPVSPETDALNGPIAVDIEAPSDYIKLVGTQSEFRIKVSLDNDGSGSVFNRLIGDYDYLTQISLKVPIGLDVVTSNCDFELVSGSGISATKTLLVDNTHNRQKSRLAEGGSHRDLSCELVAHSDYVGEYNTFDISVAAYYTYLQSVTKKLVIEGADISPLEVIILAPNRFSQDDWTKNGQEHLYVEVLYENQPITTGLTQTDFQVWIENTRVGDSGFGIGVPTAIVYDPAEDQWDLTVEVPDMGSVDDTYDITVQLIHQGYTVSDVEQNAVNYNAGA